MSLIKIRYNKSKGSPGRGTADHAWRVFEGDKEYLVKSFHISVPTYSAIDENGSDWNLCCNGVLNFDRVHSIAIIRSSR